MAKKKQRRDFGTVLSFIAPEQMAKNQSRELISLWEIRPDPNQPRSLLPSELAAQFKTGGLSPTDIMQAMSETESRNPAYENLQTLAGSIAQHGQINPISVRSADNSDEVKYIIVTGERRWWAHVLLVSENRQINEGETSRSAEQIKVSVTQKGVSIRAHQLIENLVREDLNVVEKAQGMWALREELSKESEKRVPWKIVEESLGISRPYRVRVTNVLKLTESAIKLIQLHNLSERMIRPIIQKLRTEPTLQVQALNQLIAWQTEPEENRSLVQEIKEYVDKLLAPEEQEAEFDSASPKSRPWATKEEQEEASPKSRPWATKEEQEEAEIITASKEEPFDSAPSVTTNLWTPSEKWQNTKGVSRFPTAYAKMTKDETLTDLIIMANAAGANAWQFDEPKFVKITLISKEGEEREYELPRPHEGILMLMFPRVTKGENPPNSRTTEI